MKNKTQILLNKTMWGTSHFPSHNAALRYYKKQDLRMTGADIVRKVQEGEISIGKPVAKQNQTIFLNEEEERYFIVEK